MFRAWRSKFLAALPPLGVSLSVSHEVAALKEHWSSAFTSAPLLDEEAMEEISPFIDELDW
eukprot:12923265-Prorocentrum_lima.AAC.1